MNGQCEQEFEIKLALGGEPDWRKVKRALESAGQPIETVLQENRFYDTADRALSSMGWAFRIRKQWRGTQRRDDAFLGVVLSLKGPARRNSTAVRRVEREVQLDVEGAHRLFSAETPLGSRFPSLAVGPLCETPLDALVSLARFENLRLRATVTLEAAGVDSEPVTVEVELDRTHYPGGWVFYEVEVELAASLAQPCFKRIERALMQWLDDYHVRWTMQTQGKFSRALRLAQGEPERSH
jgi:hypothetical protein